MGSIIDKLPFPGGIWLVDAEFSQPDAHPLPVGVWCVVARECRTGVTYRLSQEECRKLDAPPFPVDDSALFVCYSAGAELGALRALGWPEPVNVLDLLVEYWLASNRTKVVGIAPVGRKLTAAMKFYGLHHHMATEKREMQELAIRGAPFTEQEMADLLAYCETDVDALEVLLPEVLGRIFKTHLDVDRYVGRMLLRGEYMKAVHQMTINGIPLDTRLLEQVQAHWDDIKLELIARVDRDFGVYEGTTFKMDNFAKYLSKEGIAWPRTATGRLATDDDTWKDMVGAHPQLQPLKELTATLGKMKLNDLAVGPDGRNRCYLNPFGSNTGRNQPGNSAFIFGPAVWIRSFIRPDPGTVLLYLDWKSQEIAIAASLSGDKAMQEDYAGDFYLNFGTFTNVLPANATKASHGRERDRLKAVCLGRNYGQGPVKMAAAMEEPEWQVKRWIRGHDLRYRDFWEWLDNVVTSAYSRGWIRTRLGWQTRVLHEARPTSVQNWTMQATGSDILRVACILAHKRGLKILAPIHDAILLEAPEENWQEHAEALKECMENAAAYILPGGFSIPVDGEDEPIRSHERYSDGRGRETWETVMAILEELTCSTITKLKTG